MQNQKISVASSFPLCCLVERVPVGKPRVYPGGLLVTRAFGDFCAKKEFLGGMKDVVIADHGEIKYLNLLSDSYGAIRSPIEFLVLGSDGVWDVLSAEEVAALLSRTRVSSSTIGSTTGLKTSAEIMKVLTTSDTVLKKSQSFSKVIPESLKRYTSSNISFHFIIAL